MSADDPYSLADCIAKRDAAIAARAWDEGVRQAISWLRSDYPYGDGPEWREMGCEWIAERLAEHNRLRADEIERAAGGGSS